MLALLGQSDSGEELGDENYERSDDFVTESDSDVVSDFENKNNSNVGSSIVDHSGDKSYNNTQEHDANS